MSDILHLKSVEDTSLWKHLNNFYNNTQSKEDAEYLANTLKKLCSEASIRMKSFPSLHPQYTLHDETHLLRITELMAMIIPKEVIEVLNPVEVGILILIAHFHDQGMVLSADEIAALDSNEEFQLYKSKWIIEHPNLREIQKMLMDKSLSINELEILRRAEQELLSALLTDYVRTTHGKRSYDYLMTNYLKDKRVDVGMCNLSELAAKLCFSHTMPAEYLSPLNGFRCDESIGVYKINMIYLGLILRLADILDFDRERTPDELFRSIHFTNNISYEEWEKHRSIEGWNISKDMIRFTAKCEHPVYERAIKRFMDIIDIELIAAHNCIREFPIQFSKYKLSIPMQVDITRIEPKNHAYIYHDLEFSISRDEIIKLLMTNNLYQSPALCVRELLQNSLDALRYRKALIKRDTGADWDHGKIEFEHLVDTHGHEVLICKDNGVGMNQDIVVRFLTRVGKSYYKSPEFEKERISFAQASVDFDPCSQFGIGFMSCFMLGDHITIYTRRDYGPKKGMGEPLIVEINGLGGIVVVKTGEDNQEVGTKVCIVGRKKPGFIDEWSDKVLLTEVLDGYALATEFPINASCKIPELKKDIAIPDVIKQITTALEQSTVTAKETIEQKFSEVDSQLGGEIKATFLLDDNKMFCTSNSEAGYCLTKDGHIVLRMNDGSEEDIRSYRYENQTCVDGILVCGEPGRTAHTHRLGSFGNKIHLGSVTFILDIRGNIKPQLTPARTPAGGTFDQHPSWQRIQLLADLALGRLWEKVAERLLSDQTCETFWELTIIYGGWIPYMRSLAIYTNLYIRFVNDSQSSVWKKVSSISRLKISVKDKYLRLELDNGLFISASEKMKQWIQKNSGQDADWYLKSSVIGISKLAIENGEPFLHIEYPSIPDYSPSEYFLVSQPMGGFYAIEYGGILNNIISTDLPLRTVNRKHPIVQKALQCRFNEEQNELEQFCTMACYYFSDADVLKTIHNKEKKTSRWTKLFASKYLAVDWTAVDNSLKPPYKIWKTGTGSINIEESDLKEWSEMDVDE